MLDDVNKIWDDYEEKRNKLLEENHIMGGGMIQAKPIFHEREEQEPTDHAVAGPDGNARDSRDLRHRGETGTGGDVITRNPDEPYSVRDDHSRFNLGAGEREMTMELHGPMTVVWDHVGNRRGYEVIYHSPGGTYRVDWFYESDAGGDKVNFAKRLVRKKFGLDKEDE